MNLDYNLDRFQYLLEQSSKSLVEFYQGMESRKVVQAHDPASVRERFLEPLPESGMDPEQLIEKVARDFFDTATMGISPSFYAYVQSGGTQVGVVSEMLTAGLNQNGAKWHLSPPGVEMETLVIEWISQFLGYRSDGGGILTSGGSTANLICLSAARRVMADWDVGREGLAHRPALTAYASSETHSCLDKSLDLMGIGKSQLRKIPVTDNFTIDVDALEARILADLAAGFRPFCVIANGGTVNTGAVDPLDALANVCDDYQLWLHLDAAYGGPAAALPEMKTLFKGLDRVDSIAIDPHKWLFIPIEAGCALIKDVSALNKTYGLIPDYLKTDAHRTDRFELAQHSFQLSRNIKALKIWMTFKAYGAAQLRTAIGQNIQTCQYLADLVERAPDFELMAPAPLSILCFRYLGNDPDQNTDNNFLDHLNQKILEELERDGRVFLIGTQIHGRTALRVCLVNHRIELSHMDRTLEVLREIGSRLSCEITV